MLDRGGGAMGNRLYFGDNLHVLRKYIKDESVDLIYLDPPFNSNSEYNLLFRAPSGSGHRAQIQAFDDTWTWGEEAEQALDDIVARGGPCSALMQTFRSALGANDLTAYLVMMSVRLIELHRVLKASGALYLHCDPRASHYLKVLIDSIFGQENFRSEIIWRRSSSHNSVSRQFGPIHDTLLFYAKSDTHRLKQVLTPHSREATKRKFRFSDDRGPYRLNEIMGPGVRNGDSGAPWRGYNPGKTGRHWAIPETLKAEMPASVVSGSPQQQLDFLHSKNEVVVSKSGRPEYKQRMTGGLPLQDIWAFQPGTEGCLHATDLAVDEDVRWLGSDSERIGYPTQKPLGLLNRILRSSSGLGDVVLDPFCGCGTAVLAAQKLDRSWIGIDITHLAIHVIADRLGRDAPHARFDILGQPTDLAGAAKLAEIDKYQFQWWATWLCGGQPFGGERKGRDRGIDGTLEFVSRRGQHDWGIISVKGGKQIGPAMIRELAGTVAREKASLGVFICLAEPSKEMEREAVLAGFVELGGTKYRKIQIRTIEQLLAGKAIESPYLLTTTQEAPAAAKAPRRSKRNAIAPEELQKQRSLLLPITGGLKADAQKDLSFGEPLLVTPRPSRKKA